MRARALLLTLCFVAVAAHGQEVGLFPLVETAQTVADLFQSAQRVRRFTLEFGGFRGNRWALRPDLTPPGGDLTIWVDEGDKVEFAVLKYPNTPDTSLDIDFVDAEVDGERSNGVHLLLRSFGYEEHTFSFTAAKPGMYLLYSRWSSRGGHWGTLVVRKKR